MKQRGASRKVWVSAWIRAFAALFALLIAGDHGLASLHQALTPHEVCAEHGELVHADSEDHGSTSHAAVPVIDADALEAEHHHCGVVPAAPTRAPAVSALTECAAASLAAVESFESFESNLVIPDVLAFAPKQSPPV